MKHFLLAVLFLMQISVIAQNKYNAEVLLKKTTATVDEHGNLTISYYKKIKILNPHGNDYGTIAIRYQKDHAPYDLQARIIDSDGKVVRKLRERDIRLVKNYADDAFHEDQYIKIFTLVPKEYPYTLVYSYKRYIQETFSFSFTPEEYLKIPTKKAIFIVEIPKSYPVRYKYQKLDSVRVDTTQKNIHYRFIGRYTDPINEESLMPPLKKLIPSVTFVPYNFKFLYSDNSQKTWKDFGQWQYDMIQGLDTLPQNEKEHIRKLIKGITDTTQIIKTLYHYLQDETRYINVSIETGGLIPYPAKYVAQNKYGDCKALTNYFKSMLSFVRIPSYYTLVNAGRPIRRIDTKMPTQQFNHVILYVPRKDTSAIWLDCTSKDAFGYLGTFSQNRNALVIENHRSHLVRTPSLTPSDVLISRHIAIRFKLIQNWTQLNFDNTYRGNAYSYLLAKKRQQNESVQKQIIKSHPNITVENFTFKQQNRDSNKIQLIYQAHTKKVFVKYGNNILVKNIGIEVPDLETPKDRKYAVQIDYPRYKIDTLCYSIPLNYSISNIKKDTSLTTSFGYYSSQTSTTDSTITVTKAFLLKPGFYPLKEYPKLYQFLKTVSKHEKKVNAILVKKDH